MRTGPSERTRKRVSNIQQHNDRLRKRPCKKKHRNPVSENIYYLALQSQNEALSSFVKIEPVIEIEERFENVGSAVVYQEQKPGQKNMPEEEKRKTRIRSLILKRDRDGGFMGVHGYPVESYG